MVQNGHMDQVPVERMKDFQTRLTEYLSTSKAALLARIGKEQTISDDITRELKAAAEAFKGMWS
jgi:F-type H+-transporting ATPase subunit alpha